VDADPPAEEVLSWAVRHFGGRIVLTCSWQRQSSVLIHMLHELGAQVKIVELDTGLLFPESHDTRRALIERYGIAVESIRPRQSLAEQGEREGQALWMRNPDRCCHLRKVEPLERALDGMDAWITGIRRAQSPTRAAAQSLEWDAERQLTKVQPLVAWTDEQVMGYLLAHDVPYNRLHDRGYPSIGCMPCTEPVADGADQRSGRWIGTDKIECGLHMSTKGTR
jgi:phosphoadenosine phosphosulfate reductase